jgi:glycosyltransferase involved in cell wall biosynthesis
MLTAERVRQIIVVVDAPCTDEEEAAAAKLRAHARVDWAIRYLGTPQGLAAALNAGIDEIAEPLVARQDDDDISDVTRFDRQAAAFEADDRLVLLGCSLAYERDGRSGVRPYPRSHEDILSVLPYRNPFAHPTIMMRSAILKRYRYRDRLYSEDYDLFVRVCHEGALRNVEEPLLTYRVKTPAQLATFDHGRVFRAHARLKWDHRLTLRKLANPFPFYGMILLELLFSCTPRVFYRWFYEARLYP